MFKKKNNNLREWLKVKHLKPGMKIAVPKNKALALHYQSRPLLDKEGQGEVNNFHNSFLTEQGTEKGQGDILWDEIVSIKKLPAEQVYDIEVEGTHNFVAGHLIDRKTGEKLSEEEERETLKHENIKTLKQNRISFGGIFAHNTYLDGNATTTGYLAVGTPTFGSTVAGDVNISGAYRSNGTDYAEYFLTEDTDLQPGEAVSVDVTNPNAVKRAARAADPNIIGIVSTKPGIVGGSYGERKVVVGLLGQVPAKVSTENGEIRPGDSLTSSSLPGVLMKAKAGDSTVGVALEGLTTPTPLLEKEGTTDAAIGTIQVLISRRNKSLTVEEVEEKVQERIANMEIEDEVNLMIADSMKSLGVKEQLDQLNLKVIELEETANLQVKEFEQVKIAGELSVLGNINLNGLSRFIVGPVSIAADQDGRIIISSDSASSTAVVVEGEIKAGKIEVSEAIKTNILEADLLKAGVAEIATGTFEEIVLHTNSDANENEYNANENATSTATTTELLTTPIKKSKDFLMPPLKGGDNTAENNQKEIRIKVVETDLGEVNLNVTGGAEFAGNVVVKDLEVKGKIVVYGQAEFRDKVVIKADLELSGAIIQKFYESQGESLNFGDAVYISGDNQVSRAYADDNPYKAVVGIVVGFGEDAELRGIEETRKNAEDDPASGVANAEERGNNVDARVVKVAIGGAIKGFKDLVPGQRYFVSDLMYYINNTDSIATTTDGYAPASLTIAAPDGENLTKQVLAVAKSKSELLIMPMVGYMNSELNMDSISDESNITDESGSVENSEPVVETQPVEETAPAETAEPTETTEEVAPAEITSATDETAPIEQAPAAENPSQETVPEEISPVETTPTIEEMAPTTDEASAAEIEPAVIEAPASTGEVVVQE